jgi:hypothetical protein
MKSERACDRGTGEGSRGVVEREREIEGGGVVCRGGGRGGGRSGGAEGIGRAVVCVWKRGDVVSLYCGGRWCGGAPEGGGES